MRRNIFTILFFLLITLAPAAAFADTPALFTVASKKAVSVGDYFTVDVRVRSGDQAINAVSGSLSYPANKVRFLGATHDGSIVNFWTKDLQSTPGQINFEGIVLNPGFQGSSGLVFRATFEARVAGSAPLAFLDGSVLANDGKGTNLLAVLTGTSVTITGAPLATAPAPETPLANGAQPTRPIALAPTKLPALPVITDYSATVTAGGELYVKGKGEPNALTKLAFSLIGEKSVGERFINLLQTKKEKLTDVLVQNDVAGNFAFTSNKDLIAGSYNATPFYVDRTTQNEQPGLGAQLLVADSPLVHFLVILINVLALLVPVIGLIMVIYFIPWYSWRRMRLLRKQLGVEEEKLELSEHQLKRQDTLLDRVVAEHEIPHNR